MFAVIAAAVVKFVLTWQASRAHEARIKVMVPPTVERVSVSLWNADYVRESEFDTSQGRTTYWLEWRDVPEGEYIVDARARTTSGDIIQSPLLQIRVN